MGLYRDHVLPRWVDRIMGAEELRVRRPRCLAGVRGRVLEIGFGSGHNLPFYPPEVNELLALEPSPLSRKLAAKRVAAASFPVTFLGCAAEHIPLEDASMDFVVSTCTLCTIPDVAAALREVRRVLEPGGRLHFLEHGRAPQARLARWQNRLNPIQKLLAGGCHLNRPIDELLQAAGFALDVLEHEFLPKAPRVAGYLYAGRASKQTQRMFNTPPPEGSNSEDGAAG